MHYAHKAIAQESVPHSYSFLLATYMTSGTAQIYEDTESFIVKTREAQSWWIPLQKRIYNDNLEKLFVDPLNPSPHEWAWTNGQPLIVQRGGTTARAFLGLRADLHNDQALPQDGEDVAHGRGGWSEHSLS